MYEQIKEKLKKIQPTIYHDSKIPRAAVAIVIAESKKVLMFRRATYQNDPWSGHMAFPGGKREDIDIDLLSTARRESHEELGLSLPAEGIRLNDLHHQKLIVSAFVFFVDEVPSVIPNKEVDSVYWIELTELFHPRYRSVFRPSFQPNKDFPIVNLPNISTGIWGISLFFIDQIQRCAERV